jgi:hypothetical protein
MWVGKPIHAMVAKNQNNHIEKQNPDANQVHHDFRTLNVA